MTAQQPLSTWLACLACLSSASAGAAELRHEWFADTQTLAFNLVVDEATPLFDTFEFRAQADGEAAFGSQPQPVTISHAGEGGSGFNLWLYGCPTCFGGPPSLFGAGLLLDSEELSGSWARLGMPINEPPIHGHFADLFIAQVQLESPGPVNVSIDLYRSGSIVESHLALYNVPEPGAGVAACLAIAAAAARTRFRRWLCLPASSVG